MQFFKKHSDKMQFVIFALVLTVFAGVFVFINTQHARKVSEIETKKEVVITKIEPKASETARKDISKKPRILTNLDLGRVPPHPEARINKFISNHAAVPEQELVKKVAVPIQTKDEVEYDPPILNAKKARIVIIIDDMGVARKFTQDIIDLDAPLTLAFLPYASDLKAFTEPALKMGHELMIHVPMEPMNGDLDLGPAGLTTQLTKEQFTKILNENVFPSFTGYSGINNHMGSRLTQDRRAMGWVMRELKKRDLYFIDSKTIAGSVAADVAREYGVPYAERDVFLDHNESLSAVRASLKKLEIVARRKGMAIAIGHPKKNTILGLKEWLPSLKAKSLEIVPASAALHKPKSFVADINDNKIEIEGASGFKLYRNLPDDEFTNSFR